jgi:hypothetical protein
MVSRIETMGWFSSLKKEPEDFEDSEFDPLLSEVDN